MKAAGIARNVVAVLLLASAFQANAQFLSAAGRIEERRAAARRAAEEEQEAKMAAEEEARKKLIAEEETQAQEAFDELAGDLKRIDWDRCTRQLTRLRVGMKTREGKGVDKFIPMLVEKAVKGFEPCRKWAVKWFPDVELPEAEDSVE